tara:strand:- start:1214 stop:1600 length:387 start_codon:yes stop_codon:yes gene_type:complete
VDCDVLQADGGTRTAAITGGFVALRLAAEKLALRNLIPAKAITTQVAAVSAGIVQGTPVLDLCYEEDSAAQVDFNVVMTGQDEFVEIQGTAEGKPFSEAGLDSLVELARGGIQELFEQQREALRTAQT